MEPGAPDANLSVDADGLSAVALVGAFHEASRMICLRDRVWMSHPIVMLYEWTRTPSRDISTMWRRTCVEVSEPALAAASWNAR